MADGIGRLGWSGATVGRRGRRRRRNSFVLLAVCERKRRKKISESTAGDGGKNFGRKNRPFGRAFDETRLTVPYEKAEERRQSDAGI